MTVPPLSWKWNTTRAENRCYNSTVIQINTHLTKTVAHHTKQRKNLKKFHLAFCFKIKKKIKIKTLQNTQQKQNIKP